MFNFFRKTNRNWKKEAELLLVIFKMLPEEFDYVVKQISEGLVLGFRKTDSPIRRFNQVSFNVVVLNKFEEKRRGFFCIKGIEVFDRTIQNFTGIGIYISSNILVGYSTPLVKYLNPDLSKIKIEGYYLQQIENAEYDIVKSLVNNRVLEMINPNDVYAVKLNGKQYFHLRDLEDGDFIAIDNQKKVYKITHDPYEITELNKRLDELLG